MNDDQGIGGLADDDPDARDVCALFADEAGEADLLEWARARDLEPALVLLAGRLARATSSGQTDFVAAFVATIYVPNAAARWLLWLWDQAPDAMRQRVADMGDVRLIEECLAMHRRPVLGGYPAAAEWRSARKCLAARVSSRTPRAVVDAIAASLWDLASTPAAIGDVADAWLAGVSTLDAFEPAGWSEKKQETFMATLVQHDAAVSAERRRRSDETDTGYRDRLKALLSSRRVPISAQDFASHSTFVRLKNAIVAEQAIALRAGLLMVGAQPQPLQEQFSHSF